MRTVTFASVLDGVLALAGMRLDTTLANPDTAKAQVTAFINLRLREAWEYEFWPELCPTERRWYRPIWNAGTTYAVGAEVYYGSDAAIDTVAEIALTAAVWTLTWADDAGQAGYFTPNTDNLPAASESPATHPEKWTKIVLLRRFVPLDQAGCTPIGEVLGVSLHDPRLFPARRRRVRFTFSSEGLVPSPDAGNSVWVEFRVRPTVFSPADYADTSKVIPYVLAGFVERAAYADLLSGENRADDAGRAESRAYQQLNNAVDVSGASQSQYPMAQVQTY